MFTYLFNLETEKKTFPTLPPVRIELTTPGLRDQCSTTELKRLVKILIPSKIQLKKVFEQNEDSKKKKKVFLLYEIFPYHIHFYCFIIYEKMHVQLYFISDQYCRICFQIMMLFFVVK